MFLFLLTFYSLSKKNKIEKYIRISNRVNLLHGKIHAETETIVHIFIRLSNDLLISNKFTAIDID